MPIQLYWLAKISENPLGFSLPLLGLHVFLAMPGFHLDSRDPDSDSHVLTISTLPLGYLLSVLFMESDKKMGIMYKHS